MPETLRVLTVVGDPNRIGAWSGTPYFFLKAGKAQGFLASGLPLRPEDLRRRRLIWNLARLGRGARPGGFQYTEAFLGPLFAERIGDPAFHRRIGDRLQRTGLCNCLEAGCPEMLHPACKRRWRRPAEHQR